MERRKIENLSELEMPVQEAKKEVPAPKKGVEVAPVEEKGAKLSYEEQKELRRKQKQVEICEKKIKTLEEKMKEIEGQLAMPEAGTDIDTLTRQYLELKRELDARMEEWMLLSE